MTTVNGTQTNTASDANNAYQSKFNADFDMFLKLLTAQMQNQDPLDPMDTSEYAQQLVQYSQVEQSIQQTGMLQSILAQLSGQNMTQASAYIGKEVRFDSDVAGLGSDPATWTYYVDGTPKEIKATIKDADGKVVHEEIIDPSNQGRYSWDGKLANGTRAPEGAYTLSLKVDGGNGASLDATINSVGIVKDVVTDGVNILLGVNGIRMPVNGLVAVSDPTSPNPAPTPEPDPEEDAEAA